MCLASRPGHRLVREWKTAYLEQYSGNVPEHALQKALEIKRAVPAVRFLVEYLQDSMEHSDPDPFLVAVLGNERYYIEVWDEKEYERTM
jgi:hypothetical protein